VNKVAPYPGDKKDIEMAAFIEQDTQTFLNSDIMLSVIKRTVEGYKLDPNLMRADELYVHLDSRALEEFRAYLNSKMDKESACLFKDGTEISIDMKKDHRMGYKDNCQSNAREEHRSEAEMKIA
jgi:hypothetical protein